MKRGFWRGRNNMATRKIKGKVVSNKMQKTVVIQIDMSKRHPIYSKPVKSNKRLKVRDDIGVSVGAEVIVEECRPYSKTVTWKVVEVVKGPEVK
jgi:small subunit ribosomal protein S17